MMPRNRVEVVALMVRVVVGLWFLYNGGYKLWVSGLDRFTQDIANYQLVAAPWDAVAAYTVSCMELVVGLCLMLGWLRRGAILVTAAMVLGFCFFVAWAWWHGLDISCGCRGDGTPMRYGVKAIELLATLAALGWLWWVELRTRVGQKMQNMA